jgi:hypothetical protein
MHVTISGKLEPKDLVVLRFGRFVNILVYAPQLFGSKKLKTL